MSIPGMVSCMASSIANAIKGALSFGGAQAPGPHVTPAPMAPDGSMAARPASTLECPATGQRRRHCAAELNSGYRLYAVCRSTGMCMAPASN
jgi:hypothetical protein